MIMQHAPSAPSQDMVLQVSTVLGFVIKSQREESAWTEGIAIWVAVAVVSGVGACSSSYSPDIADS